MVRADTEYGYHYYDTDGHMFFGASGTAQGDVYKNREAFENKAEDICYIPEYGFTDSDTNDYGELCLEQAKNEGYTYSDIMEICDGNEVMARECFNMADWQSIGCLAEEYESENEVK